MDEVSDLEEIGWRHERIRCVDFNLAFEGIAIVQNVRSEKDVILEHVQLEKIAWNSPICLLNGDVSPGLVFAVDVVFNFVKLCVSFKGTVELESPVSMLPDGEVAIAKLISVGSLGHVHHVLPAMAFRFSAEDVYRSIKDWPTDGFPK